MAKFPVRYTGSLSNGLVIGGLIPVLLNILLLSMNINEQVSSAQ